MSDDNVAQTVRRIVAQACGVDAQSVLENTHLQAIGLDSVLAYEVVVEIESAFGLEVAPEHVDDLAGADLGHLILLVRTLLAEQSETP